jgi:hypothetical protein
MIEQIHYPDISIDNSESDIIQIISHERYDPQIVMIERESIPALIEMLQMEIEK